MNNIPDSSKPDRKNSAETNPVTYGERIARAAGTVSSLYFLPVTAHAAIIHVTPALPVSLTLGSHSAVPWDVDGDSNTDFRLWNQFTTSTTSSGAKFKNSNIFLDSVGFNGGGVVGPAAGTFDDLIPLHPSFVVGPTLAAGYKWDPSSRSLRNAMLSNKAIGYDFIGFNPGDNLFGFRFFDASNQLLYGYGIINFDTSGGIVSIKSWAYNDTALGSIHIENTPEPGTTSLALLGLGAGGLRAWRTRRKAQNALTA